MPETEPVAPLRHCPSCGKFSRVGALCAYCGAKLKGGPQGSISKFFANPMLVTNLLVGICVIIYGLELLVQNAVPSAQSDPSDNPIMGFLGVSIDVVFGMGGNAQVNVLKFGQFWRFVTACYLHYSLIHILFNCMALRTLGRLAEDLWGKARYWSAYWITGISSSALSFAWNIFYMKRNVCSAGASGAVFGILGMLFGLTLRHGSRINPQVRDVVRQWVVYGILFGVMVGADNAGHIGGLLFGMVFGLLLTPARFRADSPWMDRLWSVVAILGVVITVVCFAYAGNFFRLWLESKSIPAS